ncbi:hypothetical protein UY3_03982 [Chelonia mydas]|uniref:Uncharacterized protein n=1 Tax=Chelonia mydas TaxID=8469 RepID=M7C328_CHEMY|nr:hypothetical protein UY3_03982 [Chelonia mydas]
MEDTLLSTYLMLFIPVEYRSRPESDLRAFTRPTKLTPDASIAAALILEIIEGQHYHEISEPEWSESERKTKLDNSQKECDFIGVSHRGKVLPEPFEEELDHSGKRILKKMELSQRSQTTPEHSVCG